MKMPIRQLIQELLLSEIQKKQSNFHWKFDPKALERRDWPNVWTGVEEIGGYFFKIVVSFRHYKSPKKFWILYVNAQINHYRWNLPQQLTGFTIDIPDPPQQVHLDQIADFGNRLRSLIEVELGNPDSALMAELESESQFNERLPTWHFGKWRVPVNDSAHANVIKGSRIDLGYFQFIISREPSGGRFVVFLTARPNFAFEGQKQTWIAKLWTFSSIDEAKIRVEAWLRGRHDFDNHDPEHLAGVFRLLTQVAGLEPW